MNTPMTRKEAASVLLAFLNKGGLEHKSTAQGPGYPIETYSNDQVSICWAQDDPDWGITKFSVYPNGGSEERLFTAEQVKELELMSLGFAGF
jgi:hypothetical protein